MNFDHNYYRIWRGEQTANAVDVGGVADGGLVLRLTTRG